MENFRFLSKAWLCLCLFWSALLPSCSVCRSSSTQISNGQSSDWLLLITIAPGFDWIYLPTKFANLETHGRTFDQPLTKPRIWEIAYIGTFQQMQQLSAEIMMINGIIQIRLLNKNGKQTIVHNEEASN